MQKLHRKVLNVLQAMRTKKKPQEAACIKRYSSMHEEVKRTPSKINFAVLHATEKTKNTDKLEMNELQRRTLPQRILKPQKRGGRPIH